MISGNESIWQLDLESNIGERVSWSIQAGYFQRLSKDEHLHFWFGWDAIIMHIQFSEINTFTKKAQSGKSWNIHQDTFLKNKYI